MLENINSQRQLLIEQKQLLLKRQEGSHKFPNVVHSSNNTIHDPLPQTVSKIPNNRAENVNEKSFQHLKKVPTDALTQVAKNSNRDISSRKPEQLWTSKSSQQNLSSLSQSSLPPIAYTVVGGKLVATSTSPYTVYESIIAK